MARPYSVALPYAYIAVQILLIGNWLACAFIAAALVFTSYAPWVMSTFNLAASPDTTFFLWGVRAIVVVGLASIPLNYMILSRLLAIIDTVRQGAPFVRDNAYRLNTIAVTLAVSQLLSLVVGAIGHVVSNAQHPLHLDAGFSPMGWMAVLLIFILARIFAEGALMREDLDGTV